MTRLGSGLALVILVLLAGCAAKPVADWSLASFAAMQQTLDAALTGKPRIEEAALLKGRAGRALGQGDLAPDLGERALPFQAGRRRAVSSSRQPRPVDQPLLFL